MGFNIEIDYETADKIVLELLKDQYKSLKLDLQKRIDGEEICGIFLSDKEEDIAEIEEHLKGYEKVLSYNMVEEEFEELKNGTDEV
jgi:hypothetical protein